MVLRRIEPGSDEMPRSSQPSRTIDGQLASLSATLRDVRDKVSRTPTDSKSNTGPAPSEASYQEPYQDSYHDDDPEVLDSYRDVPQQDPPEYTAAPPAYDPSLNAIPKDERRKRWFTSLCFFFCALMLCILLLVTQYASRSHNRSRYNQPIRRPPHQTPVIPIPSELPASPDPSRSLTRHETSQSISGTYTLHDLIDFSTTSGSISINVQLADSDILNARSPFSPVLKLSTKSGSINLAFNRPRFSNVPLNHTTILTTLSGSCNARLVHGLSTSVSTNSGSQNLNIYPCALGKETYFMTSSKSGSQSINVHDPEGVAGTKLDNFRADINMMGSASLNLRYPRTWEGTVHASSGRSASVNFHGRNLELVEFDRREAHGTRGEGSRTELVGTGSGSISFYAN